MEPLKEPRAHLFVQQHRNMPTDMAGIIDGINGIADDTARQRQAKPFCE